jgi:predicted RNA binding protein YcfA (HicA-like mRNA interferase family)
MIETNTRKVISRLKADGWVQVGGTKHDQFEHPQRTEIIIVPRHECAEFEVRHPCLASALRTSNSKSTLESYSRSVLGRGIA